MNTDLARRELNEIEQWSTLFPACTRKPVFLKISPNSVQCATLLFQSTLGQCATLEKLQLFYISAVVRVAISQAAIDTMNCHL